MSLGSAFLALVASLLLLANIIAAGAVIVTFSMFVVELADSLVSSRLRAFTNNGLARGQCLNKPCEGE
jgi:hypothetical protein